jgi:two-component system, OmpR family, response regulator
MTPQKTIMVVEDEPAIRGLLALTLEGENYRVETASDGQEALRMMEAHAPDVILLDLMLPKLDGWGVIDALDRHRGTGTVPIIALSATQRCTIVGERGVHAFLSKPFDVDTLLTVLEEVLEEAVLH